MVSEELDEFDVLSRWFETAQGIHVAEAFSKELKLVSEYMVGNILLQFGALNDVKLMELLNFRQKILVSPSRQAKQANFFSLIENLALDKNSIDCILAPLTLEMFSDENYPLDEIDRVLKPHGYVIFFGINPCSFWGAAAYLKYMPCLSKSVIKLRSSLSLKHDLLSRGYKQCYFSHFFYVPPFKNPWLFSKLGFLDEMSKMLWTYPAGFFCFIAQKNNPCLPFTPNEQDDWELSRALF